MFTLQTMYFPPGSIFLLRKGNPSKVVKWFSWDLVMPLRLYFLARVFSRNEETFASFLSFLLNLIYDCITFFLVLSYRLCVLLSKSAAKFVVGTELVFSFSPNL